MVWVIIGCTALIIVCLGGGKRLGQIMLWAVGIVGLVVLAAAMPGGPGMAEISGPALLLILILVAFVAVMKVGMRIKAKYPDSWW